MPSRLQPHQIKRARQLRQHSTEGEKKLWQELRELRKTHNLHFRRQVPIGPYVADFAVQKSKFILEIDGEHHFTDEGTARDLKRDAWLANVGYKILRFKTGDLDDLDACITTILHHLGQLK